MKRKCLALLACLFSLSAPIRPATDQTRAGTRRAAPDTPRHEACLRFAEIIKQKTGGRYEVKRCALVPARQQRRDAHLPACRNDGAFRQWPRPHCSDHPRVFQRSGSFLFSSSEKAWKLIDGPIGKELAEKTAAKGIVMLGFWDNGIRHMTNSKHPIRTPADVKGLKFRISGDPMVLSIVQALGAGSQDIKFSEIYAALKQGEVVAARKIR